MTHSTLPDASVDLAHKHVLAGFLKVEYFDLQRSVDVSVADLHHGDFLLQHMGCMVAHKKDEGVLQALVLPILKTASNSHYHMYTTIFTSIWHTEPTSQYKSFST